MNYYDEDDCGADTMEELFHGRDVHEADFEEMNMPRFGGRDEDEEYDLDDENFEDEVEDWEQWDDQWSESYAYGFGE
jgi:hypothetical protein